MKRVNAPLALVLTLAATVALAQGPDAGFQSIFDGRSLTGWHPSAQTGHSRKSGNKSGGRWVVENGAIVGSQDIPGNGGILMTDRQYGDFEVALEMNNDFGPDSGLFLRSTEAGKADQAKAAAENPAVDALWAKLYDRPERLASLRRPVVCLLDIQHRDIIRGHLEKLPKPENTGTHALCCRLKALAGLDCLIVHQSEVTGADLERPMIKAILIGGRSKTAGRTKDEEFFALIRTTKIPMIGICGGCQLIGSAFNSKTTAMRKLRDGEKDPNPKYHPGLFKEWGFLPVKIVKADPLFAGLPASIVVREAHAYQMSVLPPEFELLASSDECRVEAVKHRQRLLYGVQFHPEVHDADHRDGETILKNFFRLAIGQ